MLAVVAGEVLLDGHTISVHEIKDQLF